MTDTKEEILEEQKEGCCCNHEHQDETPHCCGGGCHHEQEPSNEVLELAKEIARLTEENNNLVEKVKFDNAFYRKDIGKKAMEVL